MFGYPLCHFFDPCTIRDTIPSLAHHTPCVFSMEWVRTPTHYFVPTYGILVPPFPVSQFSVPPLQSRLFMYVRRERKVKRRDSVRNRSLVGIGSGRLQNSPRPDNLTVSDAGRHRSFHSTHQVSQSRSIQRHEVDSPTTRQNSVRCHRDILRPSLSQSRALTKRYLRLLI